MKEDKDYLTKLDWLYLKYGAEHLGGFATNFCMYYLYKRDDTKPLTTLEKTKISKFLNSQHRRKQNVGKATRHYKENLKNDAKLEYCSEVRATAKFVKGRKAKRQFPFKHGQLAGTKKKIPSKLSDASTLLNLLKKPRVG